MNNTNISDHSLITDNFCDLFTNIGVQYDNNIPPSVNSAHNIFILRKQQP